MAQAPEQKRAYNRKYYEQNSERLRANRREYVQQNLEQVREQNREWSKRDSAKNYRREHYLRNRDRIRTDQMRHRHDLRPEDWAVLWESQDGRCYLCGSELPDNPKHVHVDHDHRCCPEMRSCRICRRGLACSDCNIAIGHTRDDPERLRRMADALEAAQMAVNQRKDAAASEQLTLTD